MNADQKLTPDTMHRGAKMFMDSGDAADYAAALATLRGFRLRIFVTPEAMRTSSGQIALLTAVNVARRSFLGGIYVTGCPDLVCLTLLTSAKTMRAAVTEMGGHHAEPSGDETPTLLIGDAECFSAARVLRLTWGGWSGGVIRTGTIGLGDDDTCPLAAVVAACFGVGEMFQCMTEHVPGAGRRSVGISLWRPSATWTDEDAIGPALAWLPASLWLIGLGNLGQAYLWCLGTLPYGAPGDVRLVLQDFDRVEVSNNSTSVLSTLADAGVRKTRMAAAWAERVGFDCRLVEGRFGTWTARSDEADDPTVALCGVDNAYARASLEDAAFSLVVEAGLGRGPEGYGNLSVHTFPSGRTARDIWGRAPSDDGDEERLELPAYQAARLAGIDICGLVTLASKTVGVPFVGLTAAALVIAELLRRLHGGEQVDVMSLSLSASEDSEVVFGETSKPYLGTAVAARSTWHPGT